MKLVKLRGAMVVMAGATALAAATAACGGSNNDNSGAGNTPAASGAVATPDASGMVEISVKDVRFIPDKIVIRAGEIVELRMKNQDGQQHDLQVSGLEVEVMAGGAGGAEHQMATPMPGMTTPAAGMQTPAAGMETPMAGMQTLAAGMETPMGNATPQGEMGPVAMHTTANGEDSIRFVASEKGTYEFWCTITGHKEAGMVGTLTVE